jgi:4-amino-4-deoxy-L-arabinose transferase-like glycosyltransferase
MLDFHFVSESPTSIPEESSRGTAARIGWAILIVATLYVCYFDHLGTIGFVGPDEPRYAWIARDMAETGDWVTPRLYGRPWFEKPPLYYWGAAICFKVFGVSETAARLPSAISALLATLTLAWLAWRLYSAHTARWLMLLLPTTVGMIGFSHAAATDMPFSGMLTIAMVCAAIVLRLAPTEEGGASPAPTDRATPWVPMILLGIFLGLAVLAKGPAAIILSGGAVFFWAIFTKRWRDAFRLLHPVAIAAFCITALPWYILCARRNADFFHVFIIEHNFKRFLSPEFQHLQPFWYYGMILLIAILPWTALLVLFCTIRLRQAFRGKQISASGAYFASWAIFCILFFSISRSKLPGYILPSIPAICAVLAHWHEDLAAAFRKSYRIIQFSTAFIFLGLCLALEEFAGLSHHGSEDFARAAGIVIGLIGVANLVLGVFPSKKPRGESSDLARGLCVLPIMLALLLINSLLPSFFYWDPSGRTIARELQLCGIPIENLHVAAMNRGQLYSLNFYLRQEISDWDPKLPAEGYLLIGSKTCKYRVPFPWECEEVPFDLRATGKFLFHVTAPNSVSGLAGSGQPQ